VPGNPPPFKPGVHGPTSRTRLTGYGIQLIESKKLKRYTAFSSAQFRKYVEMSSRSKREFFGCAFAPFETRLDNVIYRLGIAKPATKRASTLVTAILPLTDTR